MSFIKGLAYIIDPVGEARRDASVARMRGDERAEKVLSYVEAQISKHCRTIRRLPKDEQLDLYRFEVIMTDAQVRDFPQ